MRIRDDSAFDAARAAGLAKLQPSRPRIAVGMGTCGTGNGAEGVFHALDEAIERRGLDVQLVQTGCFGFCAEEPLVNVWVPGQPLMMLRRVRPDHVGQILDGMTARRLPEDLLLCKVEQWDHVTAQLTYGEGYGAVPAWDQVPFFSGQQKIVLRNCGLINPDDIDEYFAIGGYGALRQVLREGTPEQVNEQLKAARLRGRGGAGFSTGVKFEYLRKAKGDRKYLICNADEGDPGAYMNRNELESDPHSLLEGMAIGGYVTGARHGIIYVRAEYPLAVHRLNVAIAQAKDCGVLGENILGRGFDFDIQLVEGAGAFVCGEETALIASLEGRSGRSRPRPPYPAEHGLWGYPTNINNVETWFNIPPIIVRGAAWFTGIGSDASAGTKVFSLVGKVTNTGLVEMPLGTPLSRFVYDVGGGSMHGHNVKAVQTGGPSGGCIPHSMLDTPVDYEALGKLGSIMGSGGMVVMDEDNCMVDVARYFIEFTRAESCGRCTPCRVGLDKALRTLTRITRGQGREEDLAELDELGRMIRDTSLCGLGQSAPNSVLTALRHFRHEFEDHIRARRCRAGVCGELALAPCENSCPIHMNIPRFLQLYKENRLDDAFLSVIMDNPLPASTGRVCQHPCESRCRRQSVDEPINMREVHRVIADHVLLSDRFDAMVAKVVARKQPPTGKRIAVVGAGPAGLTASFYLALLGHDVVVHESHAEPGGMLRYALPGYRLPRDVLDREVEIIRRLGVQFVLNSRIGSDIALADLEDRFDAVFLSLGTWKETRVRLAGNDLAGVFGSLHFLEGEAHGRAADLGTSAVIIGGGNSAIDCARTVIRKGLTATVIYRRERKDMPAIAEEVDAAEEEGVKFIFLASPHRIVGDRGAVQAIEVTRTRLGAFDTSGRRRPIDTGEVQVVPCNAVILAVGEVPETEFASASSLALKSNGMLDVDRYELTTSRDKVYAGGDFVSGASNVVTAMSHGKEAARSIDRQLAGEARFEALFPTFQYDQAPPQPSPCARHHAHFLPAAVRAKTFDEAVSALRPEEAHAEASRCLRCDIRETVAHAISRT
ncbi:MAG TPA: NADH-ubiquinone oxidoreductase-F iron-sulfur binding region domain-containing protein [Acetobacteraceae bacterium]|nr:NADH-ubiquinone oxidoreductase-F iron-sulfur binding region domain-containing protein [Acetobacteraceae bacterium]